MDRWSLPGPAEFIDCVIKELRDGASVVIGMPTSVAIALQSTLENRLRDCSWRLIGPFTPDDGEEPINRLYTELGMQERWLRGRSIASLIADIEKSERNSSIVIVTALNDKSWSLWSRFVEEYASASRSVSTFDRTRFLLLTSGIPKNELTFNNDPALRCFIWDAYVGEVDAFSYAYQSLRRAKKKIDLRFSKLVARIVTQLALWDFDLADKLLQLDCYDLFDPVRALQTIDIADEEQTIICPTWEEGGIAEFDGECATHSLVLSRKGDPKKELAMRLWVAQATELLPMLERKRRRLAERMKSLLLLHDKSVHDLDDKEIGDLYSLAWEHHLPPNIVSVAEKLRNIRNKLAHLAPVKADEARALLALDI
jgi:hypothetical protein